MKATVVNSVCKPRGY